MPARKINRIKIMLVTSDKSQIWLAKEMGVKKDTVSRWCANMVQPRLETLVKIAEVLGVELHSLIVNIKPKGNKSE